MDTVKLGPYQNINDYNVLMLKYSKLVVLSKGKSYLIKYVLFGVYQHWLVQVGNNVFKF